LLLVRVLQDGAEEAAGGEVVVDPVRGAGAQPLGAADRHGQAASGGIAMIARVARVVGATGLLLGLGPAAPAHAQASSYEELQRFTAVLNQIRSNYPDSVTYTGLVRAAIDGMLRSLDPHSWFASSEDYERLNALERGELAVTGIVFEYAD